jgi:diguanylate cyclase
VFTIQTHDSTLEIVSNETKKSIAQLDIVTPPTYTSIFTKFANEHNVHIDNYDKLTDTLLNEKISFFEKLQEKTSNNAQTLSDHASKAIKAIKRKDDAILNEVIQETQALRHEIEKLKESVYKDELTNVYNRRWLHDNILCKKGECMQNGGTLAIIDLNYFKLINDTFGHIVGDKVLVYIAHTLHKTKNKIIRYGGDEFLVIFSNQISAKNAIKELNALRNGILVKKLKSKDSQFTVSFSFGVAEFKKSDKLLEIIAKADENMYEDKIQIKNKITGI